MARHRDATGEGDDRANEAVRLEARYANYFQVGHNAFEILLDFGQFYAEVSEPSLHTRIITSPAYAKALARTLESALARHEQAYGVIPDPEEGPHES
jgi:hypothetical protein